MSKKGGTTPKPILGRRLWGWALFVATACYFAIVLWNHLSPPITRQTRNRLQTWFENDPDRLYTYIMPDERAGLNLTPAKFRDIYNAVVLPVVRSYKLDRRIEIQLNNSGLECIAVGSAVSPKGDRVPLFCQLLESGDGPKDDGLVRNVLFATWTLRGFAESGYTEEQKELDRFVIEGINRDSKELESLGLKGTFEIPNGLRTWNEWVEMLRKRSDKAPSDSAPLL